MQRPPGEPLDAAARTHVEPLFGHDLGRIRIHADRPAEQASRSLGALAYTAGEHIAFGAGQYQPRTPEGTRLLAHEIAHFVQQRGGSTPGGPLPVGSPGAAADLVANIPFAKNYRKELAEKGPAAAEELLDTIIDMALSGTSNLAPNVVEAMRQALRAAVRQRWGSPSTPGAGAVNPRQPEFGDRNRFAPPGSQIAPPTIFTLPPLSF